MQKHGLPHDHGNNTKTVAAQLPDSGDFQVLSELFRQLSDGSRIRLFWILCHCEECVINLSAMMEMSSPALSHHLQKLKSAGLIVSRREGKEVYYRAADTETARELHRMVETMMAISCPAEHPAAEKRELG